SHADQGGFPLPRFNPGGAHRAGSLPVSRSGKAHAVAAQHRDPGVVELLSEIATNGGGALSGARSVHPVNEAEEYPASYHGRGPDHASGAGILRLMVVWIPIRPARLSGTLH